MKKVAIIGASSLTGQKLIEILVGHPKVEISMAVSNSGAGQDVPGLDIQYSSIAKDELKNHDVIFSCLPHGKSMDILPMIQTESNLIIDLAADFRTPAEVFSKWYGIEHQATELAPATYGLSEIFTEQIKKSRFIANPGCYPTTFLLALVPLFKAKIELQDLAVFSLSGRSGAGREKSKELAGEKEDVLRYKDPYNHPHIGEMEFIASGLAKKKVKLFFFQPNIVYGVFQGMRSSILAKCELDSDEHLFDLYRKFYDGEPFIKLKKIWTGSELGIKGVINTNNCLIGMGYDKNTKRLYLNSSIDNLIKGASGQAVQNMNIASGWDQKLGIIKEE